MATESRERIEIRALAGPQEGILATEADVAVFGGGRGGSKTFSLLLEAARHVDNPAYEAVIFRRVHPEITKPGGLWPTSQKLYPLYGAEAFQSPTHEWRFPSGSRVTFDHLQLDKDASKWLGQQAPFIGFDQAETFTEYQFWALVAANRSACGVRPYMRLTCNPVPEDDEVGGWLHQFVGWYLGEDGFADPQKAGLLRWFLRGEDEALHWFDSWEEAMEGQKRLGLKKESLPLSFTFIPALLEDNPILMEADPDYEAKLMMLPRVERERMRWGNWRIRATAGELLDRAWFGNIVEAVPASRGADRVRYWDKAGTEEGKGAQTAGVRMLGPVDGIFYIEDIIAGRWSALGRERVIKQAADADGYEVIIRHEQEGGSGGKESAEATTRMLAGWDVSRHLPTGDKVVRSGPFRAQVEAGNVKLIRGDWNEAFLRQCHGFSPKAGLKDQVDAAVGGFNFLARGAAMGGSADEIAAGALSDGLLQTPSWRIT